MKGCFSSASANAAGALSCRLDRHVCGSALAEFGRTCTVYEKPYAWTFCVFEGADGVGHVIFGEMGFLSSGYDSVGSILHALDDILHQPMLTKTNEFRQTP
jgi:hypothetical protein